MEPSQQSPAALRSVSMSKNIAESVSEEVPHMIRVSGNDHLFERKSLKKSSSTSSLSRLLLLTNANQGTSTSGKTEKQSPISSALTQETKPVLEESTSSVNDRSIDISSESLADSIAKLEIRSLADEASVKKLISGKRNEVLVGIVVSRWDNIVGPQCVYLWTEERTSTFYPGNLPQHLSRLVRYVTEHTVDHHDVDGNSVLPSTLRSTLCIVRDLDLVYLSVSIRVPLDPEAESSFGFTTLIDRNRPASTVPHAVAVLANLKYLQQFLLLRPLVLNWLSEFAPKIGVLLCKSQLQSSMINSWCAELCKTMTALRTCWGQDRNTKIVDYIANVGNLSASGDSGEENNRTMDHLPPPFIPKAVLECLVTSYLTTSGSAIVVGDDAAVINQVIRFLLCFTQDQGAYCSRLVLPTLPDTFMKGLLVQGLMLGEIGAKSVSFNQVAANRHPYTHIEISKKQVRVRQSNVTSHRVQREAILREELMALWNSSALGSSNVEPFSKEVVKEGSGFISRFLEELRLLRPERRYARVLLFKRHLHAKAIALISYLESIRLKPTKDRLKLLKAVTEALGFEESEYALVQAAAEKIRPGIQTILRSKQFFV